MDTAAIRWCASQGPKGFSCVALPPFGHELKFEPEPMRTWTWFGRWFVNLPGPEPGNGPKFGI